MTLWLSLAGYIWYSSGWYVAVVWFGMIAGAILFSLAIKFLAEVVLRRLFDMEQ